MKNASHRAVRQLPDGSAQTSAAPISITVETMHCSTINIYFGPTITPDFLALLAEAVAMPMPANEPDQSPRTPDTEGGH
jgi:hypothetical protein